MNPPCSSPLLPYLELNGDQLLGQINELATCNNSNIFYPNFDKNPTNFDVNLALGYSSHPHEIKVDKRNNLAQDKCMPSTQCSRNLKDGCSNYGYPSTTHSDHNQSEIVNKDQKLPRKWKSSKVNTMQKMTSNFGNGHTNKNNNVIRVCSDCHTTTTPLWRGGPQGPKSLCNACGIRQRKARRAAMLATTTTKTTEFTKDNTNTTPMCVKSPKIKSPKQEKRKVEIDNISSNGINTLPHKKRSKIIDNAPRESCDNNTSKNNIGLVKSRSKIDFIKALSQRTFLCDEEEGAFLLMALSCGFACSSY